MKAFIQEIGLGKGIFTQVFTGQSWDVLYISNGKPYAWIFSIFTGYRQIGKFQVKRPHDFKERDWVDIELTNGEITSVKKHVD